MHTYTDEASPLVGVCVNCHEVKGNNWDVVSSTNKKWIQHAYRGRVSRNAMDKVELEVVGHYSGDPAFEDPLNTLCIQCHQDRSNKASCNSTRWKDHLVEGRASEPVWEYVSTMLTGSTCGW
jgi:cytochrome c553